MSLITKPLYVCIVCDLCACMYYVYVLSLFTWERGRMCN